MLRASSKHSVLSTKQAAASAKTARNGVTVISAGFQGKARRRRTNIRKDVGSLDETEVRQDGCDESGNRKEGLHGTQVASVDE
jgi:hypothetical protein